MQKVIREQRLQRGKGLQNKYVSGRTAFQRPWSRKARGTAKSQGVLSQSQRDGDQVVGSLRRGGVLEVK